jgi:hypothetical protein
MFPRQPDPERYCEYCGAKLVRKISEVAIRNKLETLGRFIKRKTCGMECYAAMVRERSREQMLREIELREKRDRLKALI